MNIEGLYTVVDDFFNSLEQEKEWSFVESSFLGKRGPKARLSSVEIVTLNIIRFYIRSIDLKSFHTDLSEL